jgi:ribonuclease P protein component
VIGRLSGRHDFSRLRAEGVRSGQGPIRLVSRLDGAQNAQIAFAIPRTVGNAVARNRIRRRIRAILEDLHRSDSSVPMGGDYLIRITAPLTDWPHARLRHAMATLLSPEQLPRETAE